MNSDSKQIIFKDISDIRQNDANESRYAEIKEEKSIFVISDIFEESNDSSSKTSLHWHNYYELAIVYGGRGVQVLGNSSFDMFRGFACLRMPNAIHSTHQTSDDNLKIYNIKFSHDYLSDKIETKAFFSLDSMSVTFDDKEIGEIGKTVDRMFSEIDNRDEYSPLMLRTLLNDLLVKFLRKRSKNDDFSSQYSAHVKYALKYINDNFRSEINVNQIAQALHLAPHYLGMLFIKEVGKSIINYTLDLRLTLAVQMLINTSLPINEIALESGFNNSSYFIKKFSERYGVPPLKYRLLNT